MITEEKTPNKKRLFKILIALILIICVIILAQFAWAKYMTSLNGNSKADIAKWSFKVNKETNKSFTIDLSATRGENQEAEVQDGFIGPGTSGKFIIEIDATDTEVSLEYNINMAVDYNDNNVFPKNLIFYSDEEMKNAIYHTENGITLNGFIAQSDEYKIIPHTIYWKWDFETGQTQTDKDENDIADSYWIGQNISIPIIVVGQQVNQNPTINQCAVTFDANGGIIKEYGNSEKMTKIVEYNETYGELPVPTREGYIFDGWVGKNILNNSLSQIEGIRNETETTLWATTVFSNDWVKSTLKANTVYTMSFDVECVSVPDYDEKTAQNYVGFVIYSWKKNVSVCHMLEWRYWEEGQKRHLSYTFETPSNLMENELNCVVLGYTNRYIKDGKTTLASMIISNIQVEQGGTETSFENYKKIENTTNVTNNENHILTAKWIKE